MALEGWCKEAQDGSGKQQSVVAVGSSRREEKVAEGESFIPEILSLEVSEAGLDRAWRNLV